MRSVKILMSLAVALLLGSVFVLGGCAGSGSGADSVNILNENATPGDLEMYIDSQQGKVLVAVLFNSSKPDCAAALDYLNDLADDYDAALVGFVGVSIDGDKSELQSFLADNDVSFPVLMIQAYADLEGGVPIVSLLDRNGGDYATYEGLAEIQTMPEDLDYLLNVE